MSGLSIEHANKHASEWITFVLIKNIYDINYDKTNYWKNE